MVSKGTLITGFVPQLYCSVILTGGDVVSLLGNEKGFRDFLFFLPHCPDTFYYLTYIKNFKNKNARVSQLVRVNMKLK